MVVVVTSRCLCLLQPSALDLFTCYLYQLKRTVIQTGCCFFWFQALFPPVGLHPNRKSVKKCTFLKGKKESYIGTAAHRCMQQAVEARQQAKRLFTPGEQLGLPDVFVELGLKHSLPVVVTAWLASCFHPPGTATSLTTCGLPPPPLLSSQKPPPHSQRRRCTPPSISLVISRSGAAAEDCVGLGSFPRSDYPGLLSGNEPQPLEAFAAAAASLPHPPHLLSLQTHYCPPPLFLDLVTSQFSSKMPRRPV